MVRLNLLHEEQSNAPQRRRGVVEQPDGTLSDYAGTQYTQCPRSGMIRRVTPKKGK